MIICSKCGTRVTDDAVYCPNCGKKIRRDNKGGGENETSSLSILLAVIICILAIGCAVLGFLLLSRFKKNSSQTEKSSEIMSSEKQEKPNAHNVYEQHLREIIIPETGIANTERLAGTISWRDNEQSNWYEHKGGLEQISLNVNVYGITASNEVNEYGTAELDTSNGSFGVAEKAGIL